MSLLRLSFIEVFSHRELKHSLIATMSEEDRFAGSISHSQAASVRLRPLRCMVSAISYSLSSDTPKYPLLIIMANSAGSNAGFIYCTSFL